MILFKPFLKILFLAFALVVIATPPRGGKLVMPRSDDGLQDIVSFPVIASSSQTYNLHNNTGHMGQVLYIHQRCKNSYYIWRVSSIQVRGRYRSYQEDVQPKTFVPDCQRKACTWTCSRKSNLWGSTASLFMYSGDFLSRRKAKYLSKDFVISSPSLTQRRQPEFI